MSQPITFVGWEIHVGFLIGNLADISADDYNAQLDKDLVKAFPGAHITIARQNGEGYEPWSLETKVFDQDGQENLKVIGDVNDIMERAYRQLCEEGD